MEKEFDEYKEYPDDIATYEEERRKEDLGIIVHTQ